MIAEGQVVLFRFPQTDQTEGSLRPALVLRQLPGQYNDWLICMISSQLHQTIAFLMRLSLLRIQTSNNPVSNYQASSESADLL